MKNKHFLFAVFFLAAFTFGFVGCENPDDDLLNNSDDDTSITDNDSATDGNTKPTTPEAPTLVATGGASDVEYSTVTLWGRINTDTLWAFPNIKWGIECTTSKEAICSHSGNKKLCTTDLVGENSDEYIVAFTGIDGGKMLYYNAYLLINDMKYIYGEVDSVHLDVKLTASSNNTSYGTVTGSGTYDYMAEATITATPKLHYMFVKWSDGNTDNPRTITVKKDVTYTAVFVGAKGSENGHEWVDLGLSVKWATCNVGASTSEFYGNYYAWGETSPKSSYKYSDYTYSNESGSELPLDRDAVAVNWGGNWRMPTLDEIKELKDKCTWTWTGRGYTVIGPNNNSIFLPAAGCRGNSGLSNAGSGGYYWSSSCGIRVDLAFYLYFDSVNVDWENYSRYEGRSVRGVCP